MSAWSTLVPPALVVFGFAAAASALPRRSGQGVAVAGGLAIGGWLLAVPAGSHLQTTLFGFDAVLFHVDAYSRLLGVAFGFVAAAGVAYLRTAGADRRQTAYALAYVGAGTGAVFAGDWLTLVVFWELMAVCATVLIWHRTSDLRSGVRYAIYHEIGGLLLIAAVLLHYDATGTFVYADGIAAGLPAALAALGIGLNAGFLGLHVWLVDTYPRTHVGTSVVLAAVTTKVGAYAIVRAFPGGHPALVYVGGGMVLFGVTMAILQTDMRRLLSYHIISQVGYMVAGFGAGVALARAGAMAHLVNNVLYKSLLFMVAGVLVRRTGAETLAKVEGRGRAMPATAVVFAVAALSIAGLPGFNGFVSKGMILDGIEKAGFEVLWYALVVGGVGTVISFAKFGYYAFLHGSPSAAPEDLNPLELLTLGSVAGVCVLLGLVPSLLFALLPADGVAAAAPFAEKQFPKTAAVTAAGLVVFVAVRPWLSRLSPVPDLDAVYHPVGARLRDGSVGAAAAVEGSIDRIGGLAAAGVTWGLDGRDPSAGRPAPATIGAGMLAIVVVLVLLFVAVFA